MLAPRFSLKTVKYLTLDAPKDYVLLETGNLGFCLNFTNNMCLKTLDVFQSQDNLED